MSLLDQPVSLYCTRNVVTITPDAPVSEAVKLMHSSKITSVLVCEGRLPVGIITSRDLPDIFSHDAYHSNTTVIHVMTSPVEWCHENDSLLDTLDMMINNGYRHIPVMDAHDNLTGIISETDIMNSLGFYDPTQPRRIEEVMGQVTITARPQTSLSDVMSLFKSRQLDCLVIAEDEIPLGIVTERDLSGLLSEELVPSTPVSEFMSVPVATISTQSHVQEAIQTMHGKNIHHLVAIDESGTIRGIVNRGSFLRDLTRFLIRQLVKSEKLIEELRKR